MIDQMFALANPEKLTAILLGRINHHFSVWQLSDFDYFCGFYHNLMPFMEIIHFYDKIKDFLVDDKCDIIILTAPYIDSKYRIIGVSPTHPIYKELKSRYRL